MLSDGRQGVAMTKDDVQYIIDSLDAAKAALEGKAIMRPNRDGSCIEAIHVGPVNGELKTYGFPSEDAIVMAYRTAERLREEDGAGTEGVG